MFPGQLEHGPEVVDEDIEPGVGVAPAGAGHEIDGPPRQGAVLEAGVGLAIGGVPPTGQTDEADDPGHQPPTQPLHPAEAGAVLGGGQLGGTRCGSLDQVGHPHPVALQGVAGISIDGHQPRCQRRRPEPIPGADEGNTAIGGENARVQPAHQHGHAGPDRVGQGMRPPKPAKERPLWARLDSQYVEPGPDPEVDEEGRIDPGSGGCIDVELDESPDLQALVHFGEAPRKLSGRELGGAGPDLDGEAHERLSVSRFSR